MSAPRPLRSARASPRAPPGWCRPEGAGRRRLTYSIDENKAAPAQRGSHAKVLVVSNGPL